MIDSLPIPSALKEASNHKKTSGFYMLSHADDWLEPYDADEIDWPLFDKDFDGTTQTPEGLLAGAIRVCNTGCEGYHLYVFRGQDTGAIWSDQRVPFGKLTKICDDVDEYITRIRKMGRKHITYYETFGANKALDRNG